MRIELSDKHIKITWPYYNEPSIEAEVARRLGTVAGIEGRGRCWFCAPIHVAALMDLFPKASFDYAAIAAGDAQAQAFYDMLVRFDLDLEIGPENGVVAVGEGVSPLIQQLVDERAAALRPFAIEAMARPKVQRPARQSTPLVDDERLGPLFRGIQNARKKAEEEAVQYPKRRGKKVKA